MNKLINSITHGKYSPFRYLGHVVVIACHTGFGVRKVKKHHVHIAGGAVVGFCGVVIAKMSHHCATEFGGVMVDGIGYTLHGIGLAPIIDGAAVMLGFKQEAPHARKEKE